MNHLPKSVPGAPSEERLKRKQSISTNTLRLHGGSLGIDATRAVGVDYGENLCVQMRVADLSHARIGRRTHVHKLTTRARTPAFTKASSLRLRAPEAILSRIWSSSVSSSSSSELAARRHVNPSPTASTSNLVLLALSASFFVPL